MKWKKLVPLLVILVILGGLVILKQAKDKPVPLEEAVDLPTLAPEGITQSDIVRLELFAGSKPDEKVVLERKEGGDGWVIASHFDGPVDQEKIDKYLDLVTKLKGELREEGVADSGLEAYELQDDKAFHIAAYTDEESPAFTLLVGKQADYRQVFVRRADASDVFVINESPRREAGLWQEELDTAPEATQWLDKTIAKMEKDTIGGVEIVTPYKKLVLAKETVEVETSPTEKAAAETGDEEAPEADAGDNAEEAAEEASEEAPATETKWVMQEGPSWELKEAGVDNVLRALADLQATDVADPAKTAEYGMDAPPFKCTVTSPDWEEAIILEGAQSGEDGKGYIRVASRDDATVYEVSSYNFERVFALGKSVNLFDLPGFDVTADDITRIEIIQPEGPVTLAKQGETWTIEQPAAALPPVTSTLSAVARGLANLRAADYADSAEGSGLDAPQRQAVFTIGETQHALALGTAAPGIEGSFGSIDGNDTALLIAGADINQVFVNPNDLYDRTLLDLTEDELASIQTPYFTATRADDGAWTIEGSARPVDAEKMSAYLDTLLDLQAGGILFGETELTDAQAEVVVAPKEGEPVVLRFGPDQDGQRRLAVSGKQAVFTLPAIEALEVVPPVERMLQEPQPTPEQETVEATPAQPAEEAAEAPAEAVEAPAQK